MKILLRAAKIIDPGSVHHQKINDLLIDNGKIVQIAPHIENTFKAKEIVLENLHVSAGWFDTGVSFGEPGFEERETITHGLEVAARSGFTAVAVNPNTHPVTDHKAAVEFIKSKGRDNAVSVYPIGALSAGSKGEELAEIYDMYQSGAIAFGDYNKGIANANLMKIALLYAQNFNGLIMDFPQDRSMSQLGSVNESANNTRLGLKAIPNLAEELQIARDLFILEYTGGKLHIPNISTAGSVKLIKAAKRKGLQVTCSVTPHHLSLTDAELASFETRYKVLPPLRSKTDRNALIKAVKDGTIDMISSDHNPIDIENKNLEFGKALYGSIGLDSLFGVVNTLFDPDLLSERLSTRPREVFGLPEIRIETGETAEITLFNPAPTYVFTESDILSTSKNAAFAGKELKGKVYGIYANSKLVLN